MGDWTEADAAQELAKVRRACLGLPEASERPSHGSPAFYIREKRAFVYFWDDHHCDGRLCVWCAAPDGVQQEIIETEPERFFRPPYVGHRGWIGVHLREVGQDELDAIVLEAYRTVAPAVLIKKLALIKQSEGPEASR